jgi:UDP-N-acetylmuramate--alanine ligase
MLRRKKVTVGMADSRVHFVGIGGIGMSGIAHLLMQRGVPVSGSDARESSNTRELTARGARVYIGHAAGNVSDACQLVISTAIRPDNPELAEAQRRGIPVVHRSQKLAELLDVHRGITIAGTHGKTTTSSMAATLLTDAGMTPWYAVGGIINTAANNACAGTSEWFVVEADESDGSLVNFHPEIAVITNIELDHPDFYRDIEHVYSVFRSHIRNIREGGYLICCSDDPGVQVVLGDNPPCETITYGMNHGARLLASDVVSRDFSSSFNVQLDGRNLGELTLHIPGAHNVLNALAVVAIGLRVGLSFEQIAAGMSAFRGVRRRFQIVGKNDGYVIVDDYAHHPSEIKATLAAARTAHSGRIIAMFQPHRYSRTQTLAEEFGRAFRDADAVILADIYAASEDPIEGVSSGMIEDALKADGHPTVRWVQGDLAELEVIVGRMARPGDMILSLGAGDINQVAEALSRRLTA